MARRSARKPKWRTTTAGLLAAGALLVLLDSLRRDSGSGSDRSEGEGLNKNGGAPASRPEPVAEAPIPDDGITRRMRRQAFPGAGFPDVSRGQVEAWMDRVGRTPATMALGARFLNDPSFLAPRPQNGIENPRIIMARYGFLRDELVRKGFDPAVRAELLRGVRSLAECFTRSAPCDVTGKLLEAEVLAWRGDLEAAIRVIAEMTQTGRYNFPGEAYRLTADFLRIDLQLSESEVHLMKDVDFGVPAVPADFVKRAAEYIDSRGLSQPGEFAYPVAKLLSLFKTADQVRSLRQARDMVAAEHTLMFFLPKNVDLSPWLNLSREEYFRQSEEEQRMYDRSITTMERIFTDGSEAEVDLLSTAIREKGERQAAQELLTGDGPFAHYLPEVRR